MRIVLRIVGYALLTLLVGAILTIVGFRWASSSRETRYPERAAGTGALYARAGDVDMHYSAWGPADGKPLLLVHGAMAWSQTWREIAEPLGKQGFRVIAVDMPPFGYTSKPSNQNYGREAAAKRILAFADSLGLGRYSLVAHGEGGGGALEAAFRDQDRIDSLVLMDVAVGLDDEPAQDPPFKPLLDLEFTRTLASSMAFANPTMIERSLRESVHDDKLISPAQVELYSRPLIVKRSAEAIGDWIVTGLYADERRMISARPQSYRAFDKPVLVMWGRDDRTTPVGQGEKLARLFPRLRFSALENVGHIPQMESPAETTRLIAGFIGNPKPGNNTVPDKDMISDPGMDLRPGLD